MGRKIISTTALIVTDIIVVFIVFWIAYLIRSNIFPSLFDVFENMIILPFSDFLNHYYAVIVWISVFAYEKIYTKRYSFWEEVKTLLKSSTLSFSIIMIMIFVAKKQIQFSRTVIVLAWLLSLFLFPIFHYFTKILLLKTNLWKKRLLVLGANQTSILILKNIKRNRVMGYEIVGFLDDDFKKIGKKFEGVEVVGPISELENISKMYQTKDIMISAPHLSRRKLRELLLKCEELSQSMWVVPQSGDIITEGVEVEVLGEILTLSIKKNLTKSWNIFAKNLFEKTITFILLILLFPILSIISIAIFLESKGPVIYIQKRLGQDNKMFNLFKFRSMYEDNDKRLSRYINYNREARLEWEKYKKLRGHDPRITRVGNIIRRYSLDELPQLLNVLLGNMSLVGPRPYLLKELDGKDVFINLITKVKPGITGLWQISGRSELPFNERLALDEYYIRNWSLWLDIVILIKTVKVFVSSKGAY